ncbi:MAG: hypothetical protein JO053_10190, partial [Acidobacteria bacterium]|nr:hypothetical protein [Acidobacteriota bacterium]
YFMTLGAMAVIAILLLTYFWRLGWIFQPADEPVKPPQPAEEDYEDS